MTNFESRKDFLLRRLGADHPLMRWIEVPSGCWVSTNRSKATGYGYTTSYKGRKGSQYRLLWEIVTGERVPKGMQLDHLCNNGPGGCVNPDHVQVATPRENTLRSSNPLAQKARQSHCKKGHAFTPENTRIVQRKKGHASRICLICEDERNRRYMANHTADELNEKRRAHYARKREEILAVKREQRRRKKLGLPIGRGTYEDIKKETG